MFAETVLHPTTLIILGSLTIEIFQYGHRSARGSKGLS